MYIILGLLDTNMNNIPDSIDIFSILSTFKIKLHTNSTDLSNDAR